MYKEAEEELYFVQCRLLFLNRERWHNDDLNRKACTAIIALLGVLIGMVDNNQKSNTVGQVAL